MNSSPRLRRSPAGFTLIELLTVIAIIAILVGLLITGIVIARDQARRAQAKTDAVEITASVKAYYVEYGRYPIDPTVAPASGDLLYGDTSASSNHLLFDILRNINSTSPGTPNPLNPKALVFFEGRNASDANAPRSGFAPPASTVFPPGAFIDPWGSEYRVAVDADNDNQIDGGSAARVLPYIDFVAPNNPHTGVVVYSLGKDQKLGNNGDRTYKTGSTTSDDIITWQ